MLHSIKFSLWVDHDARRVWGVWKNVTSIFTHFHPAAIFDTICTKSIHRGSSNRIIGLKFGQILPIGHSCALAPQALYIWKELPIENILMWDQPRAWRTTYTLQPQRDWSIPGDVPSRATFWPGLQRIHIFTKKHLISRQSAKGISFWSITDENIEKTKNVTLPLKTPFFTILDRFAGPFQAVSVIHSDWKINQLLVLKVSISIYSVAKYIN